MKPKKNESPCKRRRAICPLKTYIIGRAKNPNIRKGESTKLKEVIKIRQGAYAHYVTSKENPKEDFPQVPAPAQKARNIGQAHFRRESPAPKEILYNKFQERRGLSMSKILEALTTGSAQKGLKSYAKGIRQSERKTNRELLEEHTVHHLKRKRIAE